MKPDIEIARETAMSPIEDVALKFGVDKEYLEFYGKYKAKLSPELYKSLADKPDGKLVLVTAINPTPAGEGKTTTTVGLAQALNKLGVKAFAALREPSLGPCMGVKGGAAGGGYAQVVPMEDINLHFTGDLHAITCAHNLLSAMIDNHIQQGNVLGIDPRNVTWKRALDMNDRSLRHVVVGLGGKSDGTPREDGFIITVASEIMAILCLCDDLYDLKERLSKIIIGYNYANEPITCADLNAQGALAALLKDAVKPNLVQTLEHTPAIIHGGPFANIAHGCNSVQATRLAMKLADVTVTEAGFGADLGAEKFFDIKCRKAGLKPDCAVIVATVRALKYNGGVDKKELSTPNAEAVKSGFRNLSRHITNVSKFGVPVVVAINRFGTDSDEELAYIKDECEKMGAKVALSEVFAKGGDGGLELGRAVMDALEGGKASFRPLYADELTLKAKIETVCREIYGAGAVNYTPEANTRLNKITKMGFGDLPVCIAKTQYSLSDNPALLGSPEGFTVTVREVSVSAGAGFVVAITGDIMTMPGLPKVPAACGIDVDEDGVVSGLF